VAHSDDDIGDGRNSGVVSGFSTGYGCDGATGKELEAGAAFDNNREVEVISCSTHGTIYQYDIGEHGACLVTQRQQESCSSW
jgi:hypothetical protein